MYISADGNYCHFMQSSGESRLVTAQLGQIEQIISSQIKEAEKHFLRIGKSLIINRTYIHYINISRQQLVLADKQLGKHTLTASQEALRKLKELIEKE
jgi:DNA-binding LytR/AlgR family response regulator